MRRVDVVDELHKVVARAGTRAPRDALNVCIERMQRVDLPVVAQWILMAVDDEDVRPAQQLVVDESTAESIAEGAAISPIAGHVDPLARDVRVAQSEKSNEWASLAAGNADDERKLVCRSNVE
jgi:hypothetical protein